jgi:predicted dehydrogenase
MPADPAVLAPAVQHGRELVRSGQIGRVTHVNGVFINDYAADAFSPRGVMTWRFERALAGSGALGDLASHTIDMLRYVVGPIVEVAAITIASCRRVSLGTCQAHW